MQLAGSATDDGLPNPPGALTYTWSVNSGPAEVAFGNPNAAITSATFTATGNYSLRLTASDGALAAHDDVTIAITANTGQVSLAPVPNSTIPTNTTLSLQLDGQSTDALAVLTYSLVSGPGGAKVSPSGVFSFTPSAGQLGGPQGVTARVQDGAGHSAQTSFNVTVVGANRPPVLGPLPDVTLVVGNPFSRTLTASDPDAGDTLSFALLSGPAGMTLAGATLNWSTTGLAAGAYSVVVKVTDSHGASNVGQFTITLTASRPPLAYDDHYEVTIGETLVVPAAGVLANDLDPLGLVATLSAQKLTDPDKGAVQAFGANGGFTYQAPAAPALGLVDPTLDLYLGPADGVRIGGYPPLVADLDGDGKPELIYWHLDQIYAVTIATNTLLFQASSLPAPYNGCAMYGRGASRFAVADIDDSGLPSIVMGAQCAADNADYIYHLQSGGNHVVAVAYDPSPGNASHFKVKWLSDGLSPSVPVPPPGDGHLYMPFQGMADSVAFTIARLAPGEKPTVLFGKTYGGGDCGAVIPGKTDQQCRIVFAVDGQTGALKTPYYATPPNPASASGYGEHAAGSYPAPIAADFDSSGAMSIIYEGTWWAKDGTVKRQFDGTAATNPATHDSVVADLDGDGTPELIALEALGKFDMGSIKAWKLDGTLLWTFPIPRDLVVSKLTVGDIDRDGKPDILFGKRQTLYALGPDGAVKWLRSLPTSNFDFVSPFSDNDFPIYDLDGDGVPEIIVQIGKNTLHFLRGDTGETQATWQYPGTGVDSNQSVLTPIVADLTGDGHARVGFYHDVNLNGTNFFVVLKSNNVPWQKVPAHLNQRAYWGTNFLVDATHNSSVPTTYAKQWLTPSTNVFGGQPQAPYVAPPEQKLRTTFTYEAAGGGATSAPATVTIDIKRANRPPKFTSRPPWACADEVQFQSYQLTATDPDPGDTLNFTILYSDLPYFEFNGATGVINFRCGYVFGSAPRATLAIVTDSHGASSYQQFTTVPSGTRAPMPNLVGMTQQQAATLVANAGFAVGAIGQQNHPAPAGQVIQQYPLAGVNTLLGDVVDITLSKGPSPTPVPAVIGQELPAANALLAAPGFTSIVILAPSNAFAAGTVLDQSPPAGTLLVPTPANPVTLTVSSGANGNVIANIARIDVKPGTALRLVGETLAYRALAVYTDGTGADITSLVTWSSSATGVATIDVAGNAKGVAAGTATIKASVSGLTGAAPLKIVARALGDAIAPVALIVQPADNGVVTAPTQIVGTATDANFLRYELAVAAADNGTFTLIGEGTSAIANDVLGTLDPTPLLNGPYVLRLTVFDAAGNQTEALANFLVTGQRKVGLFTLTYQDLALPVAGVPIVVRRTYDSRDKAKGDFGVGWRLDVNTIRVSANRTLGGGWEVVKQGLTYGLQRDGDHYVNVTLPNGEVETFDVALAPTTSVLTPFSTLAATFVPRSGTLGTLESLDNTNLLIVDPQPGPVTLLDDTTLNTFHPDRFLYTSLDGTKTVVTRTKGVESVRDRNGNQVTIGPAGIVHSSGKSIAFTRDGQGRITQITDPLGKAQTYTYDAAGDLRTHTDAVGNQSKFAYDVNHGLVDIQDPAGNHAARNEYDDAGLLIATIDAQGNRITYTHDLAGAREIVVDRLGNQTVVDYDANGNVIARTDALGKTTTYTYDSRNNRLTETDPLGRVATKTYDAHNNVLTSTDFDGNTTTWTYDAQGQVLGVVDPEGRTTVNVYDANGNLLQTTDPEGGVTKHTYDASGNRLSTIDPLNHTTTFAYDASGNKTAETNPLGKTTSFAYDAAGRLTVETDAAGKSTLRSYDATGRLTGVTDALGYVAGVVYSTVGNGSKVASRTDRLGNVMQFEYDTLGNTVKTTFPDGSFETTTYDLEGRVLASTDRDGNVTTNEYDALGRVVRTTYADGTFRTRAYDAVGRVVAETDERGNATAYAYAANQQTVTDPLGKSTVHRFDSAKRIVQTADALGHVTQFAYDSAGNLTKTTYHDATFRTATYDAAKRKVAETDPAGRTTQYAYDAAGQLTSVTNAAGNVTAHAYDAVGNRITQTDANGHATQMSYDAARRLVSRTNPAGKTETFAYDASGRTTAHTDFNGQTTVFAYDAMGRLVQKTPPSGPPIVATYTPGGRRATAGGDSYLYDVRGRLVQEHKVSGESLTYAYDAAGNVVSLTAPHGTTTYTHDALNRLASVSDATGTATYAYDAVGNLASMVYPNGVTATYGYDSLNRLVQVANSRLGTLISSYTYTLGPAGNRVQVLEAGPATAGRTVSYSFDSAYRMTQEAIAQQGQPNVTIAYAYDGAGNRTQMNRNGVITTYAYDASDRLLTETTGAVTVASTYDHNGNLKSRGSGGSPETYSYDFENRLVAATTFAGALAFTYDVDGMRTSRTAGGVTTNFLLDKAGVGTKCPCPEGSARSLAQVLAETRPGNLVTYTRGHALIGLTQPFHGTRFHLADGALSVRQLTNTGGGVTDQYTFDAFGVGLGASGSTPNTYLYAGEQVEPNANFYYLRERYYQPDTGRFVSTDPHAGNIFEPPTLHRYLYAGSDPVDNRDPSGRDFSLPSLTVAQAVGISISAGFVAGVGSKALGIAKEWSTAFGIGATVTSIFAIALVGPAIQGVQAAGELVAANNASSGTLYAFIQWVNAGEMALAEKVMQSYLARVFVTSVAARCLFLNTLQVGLPVLLMQGIPAAGPYTQPITFLTRNASVPLLNSTVNLVRSISQAAGCSK